MKALTKLSAFLVMLHMSVILFAQQVTFNKIAKTHDGATKEFFQIKDNDEPNNEFLGEILIEGASIDPQATYAEVYKKAKEIGANSYKVIDVDAIDGQMLKFNPNFFTIRLYHSTQSPTNEGRLFLISDAKKMQKVKINDQKFELFPGSFAELILEPGKLYTISNRKFLGSSIKLSVTEKKEDHYILVSGTKVKAGTENNAGLNFMGGDLQVLNPDYGQFLLLFQHKINIEYFTNVHRTSSQEQILV